MEYITATEQDIEQIADLVQETIKTIYPKLWGQVASKRITLREFM